MFKGIICFFILFWGITSAATGKNRPLKIFTENIGSLQSTEQISSSETKELSKPNVTCIAKLATEKTKQSPATPIQKEIKKENENSKLPCSVTFYGDHYYEKAANASYENFISTLMSESNKFAFNPVKLPPLLGKDVKKTLPQMQSEAITVDLQYISLFMADRYAPDYFDGGNSYIVNLALQNMFKSAGNLLLKEVCTEEIFNKIRLSLSSINAGVSVTWSPTLAAKVILDKIKNLDCLPENEYWLSFGDSSKSIVVDTGFKGHAMLCEFIKVKSSATSEGFIYKLLVFNTGEGTQYHQVKVEKGKETICTVMVFNGMANLVDENFIYMLITINQQEYTTAKHFYESVMGEFDEASDFEPYFISGQRTGTCSVSCYHAYFILKIGRVNYERIKFYVSLTALTNYFGSEFDFMGSKLKEKFHLSISDKNGEKSLKFNSNDLCPKSVFNIHKWNEFFVRDCIRYLYRLNHYLFEKQSNSKFSNKILIKGLLGKFKTFRYRYNSFPKLHTIGHSFCDLSLISQENYKWVIHINYDLEKAYKFVKFFNNISLVSDQKEQICLMPDFSKGFEVMAKTVLSFLYNEAVFSVCFKGRRSILYGFIDSLCKKIRKNLHMLYDDQKNDSLRPPISEILVFISKLFDGVYGLFDANETYLKFERVQILQNILNLMFHFVKIHIKLKFSQLYKDGDFSILEKCLDIYRNALSKSQDDNGYPYWINLFPNESKPCEGETTFNLQKSEIDSLYFYLFSNGDTEFELSTSDLFTSLEKVLSIPEYLKPSDYDHDEYKSKTKCCKAALYCGAFISPDIKMPYFLDAPFYDLFKMRKFLNKSSLEDGHYVFKSDYGYKFEVSSFKIQFNYAHSLGGCPKYLAQPSDFYFDFIADNENEVIVKSEIKDLSKSRELQLTPRHSAKSILIYLCILNEDFDFILTERGIYYLYHLLFSNNDEFKNEIMDIFSIVWNFFIDWKTKLLSQSKNITDEFARKLVTIQIVIQRLSVSPLKQKFTSAITSIDIENLLQEDRYKSITAFLNIHNRILNSAVVDDIEVVAKLYADVFVNLAAVDMQVHESELLFVFSCLFSQIYDSKDSSSFLETLLKFISDIRPNSTITSTLNNELLTHLKENSLKFNINSNVYTEKTSVTTLYYKSFLVGDSLELLLFEGNLFSCLNNHLEILISIKNIGICTTKYIALSENILGFAGNRLFTFLQIPIAKNSKSRKINLFNEDMVKYGQLQIENYDNRCNIDLTIDNPNSFIDQQCKETKFSIYPFDFFHSKKYFNDVREDRGNLFLFSRDHSIYSLIGAKSSYYIFSNFVGDFTQFYVKQCDSQWLLKVGQKEYIIHAHADTDSWFAVKAFPVFFVSLDSDQFIVFNFPKGAESSTFSYMLVPANHKFEPIIKNNLHLLIIIYWLIDYQYYYRALKYLVLFNHTLNQFTSDEIEILSLIVNHNCRRAETKLFSEMASKFLALNQVTFDKKDFKSTDTPLDYLYVQSLIKYRDFLPSYYWQVASSIVFDIDNIKELEIYLQYITKSSCLHDPVVKKGLSHKSYEWEDYCRRTVSDYSIQKSLKRPLELFLNYVLMDRSFNPAEYWVYEIRTNTNVSPIELIIHRYLSHIRYYGNSFNHAAVSLYSFTKLFYEILKSHQFNPPPEVCDLFKAGMFSSLSGKYKILSKTTKEIASPSINQSVFTPYNLIYHELQKVKDASHNSFHSTVSLLNREPWSESQFKNKIHKCLEQDKNKKASRAFEKFAKSIFSDDLVLIRLILASDEELSKYVSIKKDTNGSDFISLIWRYFYNEKYLKIFGEKARFKGVEDAGLNSMEKIFMIVEYFSEYIFTSEQHSALIKIFDSLQKGKPIIYQLIMGGGKTTVLGTCLALFSTHWLKRMPIYIFPSTLIDGNAALFNNRFWNFFGKKLYRLHITRSNQHYSIQYLRLFFYSLYLQYINGDISTCTPEVIQCLQNARKELLYRYVDGVSRTPDSLEQLDLILRILHFIENYCILIVDEIDTVMNLTSSFNFNTPEIEMHSKETIDLIVEIMISLKVKTKIPGLIGSPFQIDSPPQIENEELLMNSICSELPKEMLEKIDKVSIIFYLKTCILPAIQKTRNYDYGLPHHRSIPYVVPYSAANTPVESSDFQDYWFILALTLKFYLETDLEEQTNFFKKTNLLLFFRMISEPIPHPNMAFPLIIKMISPSSLNWKDNFRIFFKNYILPEIITFKHQYFNSAFEFISACPLFVGYSGTLYDKEILKNIKDVVIDDTEGISVETKILGSFSIRPCNFPLDRGYPEVNEYFGDRKNVLDEIFSYVNASKDKALFDIGAVLKDYSNLSVATQFSKKYECVLFYEKESNMLKLLRNGNIEDAPTSNHFAFLESSIINSGKEGKILLYLDESHTIGVDIDLGNVEASCVATVSSLTGIKQLLQGLLRARKLIHCISYIDEKDKIKFNFSTNTRQSIRFFHTKLLEVKKEQENIVESYMKRFYNIFPKNSIAPVSQQSTIIQLEKIFKSCALNQYRSDQNELKMKSKYTFYSAAIYEIFKPITSKCPVPTWDNLLSIKQSTFESIVWIFYCEPPTNTGDISIYFSNLDEEQKNIFQNLNWKQFKNENFAETAVDRFVEIQILQEAEICLQLETKKEILRYVSSTYHRGFSEYCPQSPLPLSLRFSEDFVNTIEGTKTIEGHYAKCPIFFILTSTKDSNDSDLKQILFISSHEYANKTPANANLFCLPLIHYYDKTIQFEWKNFLDSCVYSGSFIQLFDARILHHEDSELIFGLLSNDDKKLEEAIYNAMKWGNQNSVEFLQLIKKSKKKAENLSISKIQYF